MSSGSQPNLPNIPGFRSSPARPSKTSQSLKLVHGHMIVTDKKRPTTTPGATLSMSQSLASLRSASPTKGVDTKNYYDLGGRYSIRSQSRDRLAKTHHLPYGSQSMLPNFLKFDRKVLCFDAYYSEQVHESAVEEIRVRKCVIYYYLEDGTIQMVEHQQENSGIPQGVFIRRHQVPNPQAPGQFYTENDVYVGAELNVYNKFFKIVDCNDSTRSFLAQDLQLSPDKYLPLECPEGEYNTMLRAKMQRETGADLSIKRNRKMHPMKMFMEAQLGKPQSALDLGAFLENDRKVLRFDMVWDATCDLYGDVQAFKLHYFLADDTMEILQVRGKNDGRDPVPKLLNRGRLPKLLKAEPQGAGSEKADEDFFHWTDLQVGTSVTIYNRSLVIVNADPFTKSFYEKNGVVLNDKVAVERAKPPSIPKVIPVHSGFGSEEDSLRSCYSIRPTPKRDIGEMKKLHEHSGHILRFRIKLLSDEQEDLERMFILNYYLEDDTMAIREPPLRNSGHIGGNFLSRTKIKKEGSDETYTIHDLREGTELKLQRHRFVISQADEYTRRYLADHQDPGRMS